MPVLFFLIFLYVIHFKRKSYVESGLGKWLRIRSLFFCRLKPWKKCVFTNAINAHSVLLIHMGIYFICIEITVRKQWFSCFVDSVFFPFFYTLTCSNCLILYVGKVLNFKIDTTWVIECVNNLWYFSRGFSFNWDLHFRVSVPFKK